MASARKSIWTNNPLWQDQTTGETTAEGTAHLKSKRQLSLMEENMASKFAKKDETTKETKAPKSEKAKAAIAQGRGAKKAGKKPAAKAPKAEKAEKGPDTRKITVLSKENPKRAGSKAAGLFDLYKKAKTVEDFYKAGGTKSCLAYDIKNGHIKVA